MDYGEFFLPHFERVDMEGKEKVKSTATRPKLSLPLFNDKKKSFPFPECDPNSEDTDSAPFERVSASDIYQVLENQSGASTAKVVMDKLITPRPDWMCNRRHSSLSNLDSLFSPDTVTRIDKRQLIFKIKNKPRVSCEYNKHKFRVNKPGGATKLRATKQSFSRPKRRPKETLVSEDSDSDNQSQLDAEDLTPRNEPRNYDVELNLKDTNKDRNKDYLRFSPKSSNTSLTDFQSFQNSSDDEGSTSDTICLIEDNSENNSENQDPTSEDFKFIPNLDLSQFQETPIEDLGQQVFRFLHTAMEEISESPLDPGRQVAAVQPNPCSPGQRNRFCNVKDQTPNEIAVYEELQPQRAIFLQAPDSGQFLLIDLTDYIFPTYVEWNRLDLYQVRVSKDEKICPELKTRTKTLINHIEDLREEFERRQKAYRKMPKPKKKDSNLKSTYELISPRKNTNRTTPFAPLLIVAMVGLYFILSSQSPIYISQPLTMWERLLNSFK